LPGLRGSIALLVFLFGLVVVLYSFVELLGTHLQWPERVRVDLGLLAPQAAIAFLLAWYLPWARLSVREAFPMGSISASLVMPLLVSMAGMFALVLGILGVLENYLGTSEALEAELERIFKNSDLWVRWLAMAVFAPVSEELFFRGLILQGLLRRLRPGVAIAISSFFFGLLHLHPYRIVVATLLGAHLGWWFHRTRSLLPCIGAHAFVNFTVGCLLPSLFGEEFLEEEGTWSALELATYIAGGAVVTVIGFRAAAKRLRAESAPDPSAVAPPNGAQA
jgi:membrane protease YdiL (CAAX protease family)